MNEDNIFKWFGTMWIIALVLTVAFWSVVLWLAWRLVEANT